MAKQRIKHVQLLTAVSLADMKRFYRGKLGLAVPAETAEAVTFAGGQTALTFRRARPAAGNPFYHFAFNIPENKILAACHWQRPFTYTVPNYPYTMTIANRNFQP